MTPATYPATRAELLATAQRLREQAVRHRNAAEWADSAQARLADLRSADECRRNAERMEKEAAEPYGRDGPCPKPGCTLTAKCPDCGPSLIDFKE